jgi:hypothetical protein
VCIYVCWSVCLCPFSQALDTTFVSGMLLDAADVWVSKTHRGLALEEFAVWLG